MCELHRGGRLTSRTLAAAVSSLVVCAALLMPPCSGQPVSADSLSWVTYLGGIASDDAAGVAMDAEGYIYVTGVTRSAWSNPGDPSPVRPYSSGDDPADAYVARLEPDGDLVWYTFLGGGGNDAGAGIAVDSDYVYVTGRSDNYAWSQSGDGTPVRAHSAGSDAFVARLGADDGVLDWHTFLGGGSGDIGCCVAVDAVGNIFVA